MTTGSSTEASTSTTSTTSATGDADTSTTEPDNEFETGSFIPVDPKGSGNVECDVWAQDCKASHKCQPWANDGGVQWNATLCALVDKNAAALGEPCVVLGSAASGLDTCDHDTMCWNVDASTNVGTCVARCTVSEANPTCDDGVTCMISHNGVINLCVPPCDPLLPSCDDGFACVQASLDVFGCVPSAVVTTVLGAPCDPTIGCGTGLLCTEASTLPNCDDTACCAPLCDLHVAGACPDRHADQTCDPVFVDGTAPPGLEDVGVCRIPPVR